jgi:hypothetical protein
MKMKVMKLRILVTGTVEQFVQKIRSTSNLMTRQRDFLEFQKSLLGQCLTSLMANLELVQPATCSTPKHIDQETEPVLKRSS